MNRRPWPIVLVATLQFFSPLIYVLVASIFYRLSPIKTFNEIWALNSNLRLVELFLLPVLIAGLIYFTRKSGYLLAILGSVYLMVRGVMEFIASNETDPVFPIVLTNLFCLFVVGTLLRPKNRSVYFNPRLRWWETSPRFLIRLPASLTRIGAKPVSVKIENIAVGGAGLECSVTGFLKEEIVDLEFQYEGETFKMKSTVIWEGNKEGSSSHFIGLQWADQNAPSEFSKVRKLMHRLYVKKTPTTREVHSLLNDFREWFAKLAS